ncbi:MAG: hypothetical protein HYT94_04880 [Parcubacteria group bacterium]|nr:hypothetical protein [Parcubacteria group bacterium]
MKKKIYFIVLIAAGILFSVFSYRNAAFAEVTEGWGEMSCTFSSSPDYCITAGADRSICDQNQANCWAELPVKCISAYGSNVVLTVEKRPLGGSMLTNRVCNCEQGYVHDDDGHCRTPSEISCRHLQGSNRAYYGGTCGCENGYQLVDGQCIAQAIIDAQKKAEYDEKQKVYNALNTEQCSAFRGENAEYKDLRCGCKDGYQPYIGNRCITATEACQNWYGPSISTTADKTTCECAQGYVLSGRQCVPLAQPVSVTPIPIPPPAPVTVVLPSPTPTVMPKIIPKKTEPTKPLKKKIVSLPESETKTPPLSEIVASTTSPQEITTAPTEAPEIVRPAPPAPIVKRENVFQRVWKKFLSWF